jgi:hypothetical protein
MTLATLPVIGSTPDDTLPAVLDSLLARYDTGAVADGHIPSLGRQMRPRRLQRAAGAFPGGQAPTSLTSVGRILTRFWAKGALARKRQHLGPSLRRNPLPVIEARSTNSRATGHGPPKNIATFNTHTEALEPMAGALWTSYNASFPAQMGGGDEKALPSRRQAS